MGEIRLYAESLANRVFPAIVLLEKEGDANKITLGRYEYSVGRECGNYYRSFCLKTEGVLVCNQSINPNYLLFF